MEQTMLFVVNTMLSTIDEDAVQLIDKSHPDVKIAVDIWDIQNESNQLNGWWYNQETYQLVPDARSGEVFLPGGCIAIDAPGTSYIKRGRRLYDKDNHTFIFDPDTIDETSLSVTCIMEWDIAELPPVIFHYVLNKSILDFYIKRGDSDQGAIKQYSQDVFFAFATVQKQHLRYSGPNRLSVNAASTLLNAQTTR